MSLIFFSFLLCHRCESIVDVILASAAARNIFKSICYITCDVKKYNIVISIYMWCYCRAFFYYIRSSICVNAVHFISGAAWKRLHHRPTEFFKMNCVWMFDWFVFQLKYKMKIRWWWWWWNFPKQEQQQLNQWKCLSRSHFSSFNRCCWTRIQEKSKLEFFHRPTKQFFSSGCFLFLERNWTVGILLYNSIVQVLREMR